MTEPFVPEYIIDNWDLDLIAILAAMAPNEQRAAEEWWRLVAPALYRMLLEALPYEGTGWPDSAEEWELLIQEEELGLLPIEQADLANRSNRYLQALGLGTLFFYSLETNTYRRQGGSTVTPGSMRTILDLALERGAPNVRMLTERLRMGTISPDEWRAAMAEHIKRIHWTTGLMAFGGRNALTQQQIAYIENAIAKQFGFLDRRYRAILSGEQLMDGTILRRALMYNSAAHAFYYDAELSLLGGGYDLYRNVLTAKESCAGSGSCPEQSGLDWVPIGTLIPIGSRTCMSNCRCYYEYQNSLTGDIRG